MSNKETENNSFTFDKQSIYHEWKQEVIIPLKMNTLKSGSITGREYPLNFFTIDTVVNILKEKYLAVELDKKYFEDLKSDRFIKFVNIIGAYTITDIKTLENLYSAEEKIDIFELIEYNKTLVAHPDDSENELAEMWSEVQEGRRINIILESDNGINISGFTVQGGSEKICDELFVMQGLDAEECKLGNEKFHSYLKSLLRAGYL